MQSWNHIKTRRWQGKTLPFLIKSREQEQLITMRLRPRLVWVVTSYRSTLQMACLEACVSWSEHRQKMICWSERCSSTGPTTNSIWGTTNSWGIWSFLDRRLISNLWELRPIASRFKLASKSLPRSSGEWLRESILIFSSLIDTLSSRTIFATNIAQNTVQLTEWRSLTFPWTASLIWPNSQEAASKFKWSLTLSSCNIKRTPAQIRP